MIYLDSCLLIYLVERTPRWSETTSRDMMLVQPQAFCISPLVLSECLVGPLRQRDIALEHEFLRRFADFETLDISEADFLEAARIRARSSLKLPDALHVACAQRHGCTEFWTNDNRLSAFGPWVRVLTPA